MTPDLPADVAAAEVAHRFDFGDAVLCGYWVSVQSDRASYADALRRELADQPITVIVLRAGRLFTDPNSVMSDLIELLESEESRCRTVVEKHSRASRFGVVIVARTTFPISQSSSPMVVPTWLPGVGGKEVHCSVEDISESARVALNHLELGLPELHRRLYDLEAALQRRLGTVARADESRLTGLINKVAQGSVVNPRLFLSAAETELRSIKNPDAWRPSAKYDKALVPQLWKRLQDHPGRTHDLAQSLAVALRLDPDSVIDAPDSLFGALARPNGSNTDPVRTFADNLLSTLLTALRFMTVAAHADDYGRFPFPLLRSTVLELRNCLASYEVVLNFNSAQSL